jgi:glycosyltransferase 2 family protein
MKKIILFIKPYLRWLLVGITFIFVLKTFKNNWQNITTVTLDQKGYFWLSLGLLITLIAHIWSAWVWTWILKHFKQPISNLWAIRVYLITNIAKYLPGNVGHFYGRISAISQQGGSISIASFIVLLEPLLMAAAALLIALLSHSIGVIKTTANPWLLFLQVFSLMLVLLGIHPRILNRVIHLSNKFKKNSDQKSVYLEKYPFDILGGEVGFILLRGLGFICVCLAFMSLSIQEIFLLISAFSFAWLLGLIIPGAPGGIGVFEATMIALLKTTTFPLGIILTIIAIFRVISILAEVIGAKLGLLLKPS